MSEKPFEGFSTFLKSTPNNTDAKVGVVGIPFDGSVSYRPGSRFGPGAIRQASMMLTDGCHPEYETEPRMYVSDFGDISTALNFNRAQAEITSYYDRHPFVKDGKPMLALGGDHSISTGIMRSLGRRYDYLSVIHIDAHCDTWADHFGEPMGHGTWVRNVIDERLVAAQRFLSIGMRSPVDPETRDWLTRQGGRTITTRQAMRSTAYEDGLYDAVSAAVAVIGSNPFYISFDIDALDPAFAPGTGTPEFGGLTPHWALEFLRRIQGLIAGPQFVGMDLVEVNPSYDPMGITALAGATLLWTVASMRGFS